MKVSFAGTLCCRKTELPNACIEFSIWTKTPYQKWMVWWVARPIFHAQLCCLTQFLHRATTTWFFSSGVAFISFNTSIEPVVRIEYYSFSGTRRTTIDRNYDAKNEFAFHSYLFKWDAVSNMHSVRLSKKKIDSSTAKTFLMTHNNHEISRIYKLSWSALIRLWNAIVNWNLINHHFRRECTEI